MGRNITKEHINETMNQMAAQTTPVAVEEAKRLLEIQRNQIFIEDDSAIANPYSFLGKVIEIRKINGKCPDGFIDTVQNPDWSLSPIPGRKIDENSKIKTPEKVKAYIVDNKIAAQVSAMQYFAGEIDANSAFNVIVFNQATGLVDVHDDSWNTGLDQWRKSNQDLMTDPNICYLLVVTGMVQKNIIRKKYVKFEAKAKGGAFGVNINGELYSSTEDFSLDTRFGLTVNVIRRPIEEQSRSAVRGLLEDKRDFLLDEPSDREMALFQSIQRIKSA